MKKLIKCRSCLTKNSNLVYKSPKLPEYIWPVNSKKKIKQSSCFLFICENCGHLQLQKFSKNHIKSFYGKKSFVISTNKKNKIRKHLFLKKYGTKIFNKKKILEIGGGVNPFLPNLSNYTILDFSFEKLVRQKYKNIIQTDFENFNNNTIIYDIVILFHTLEHFLNPCKIVKNLNKITYNKSLVFVEVPNICYYINNMLYNLDQ